VAKAEGELREEIITKQKYELDGKPAQMANSKLEMYSDFIE